MADTKTSEVLAQEAGQQKDLGLYSQGKLKLNYDEEAGIWNQEYEPVKPSKMFIPPAPKQVTLPTDVTLPGQITEPSVPTEPVPEAQPIVQPRDSGESFAEKRRREDMERFGPGQDPMTFSKTMSNILTPGTEQNLYYSTRGILTQEGDKLTVNFDNIDEAGGYGLPSILGGVLKVAEKDIIESTINKLRFANIIKGDEVQDVKGTYEFTIDRDKMDKYTKNVSNLATKLTGGYRDDTGTYRQRNDYLIEELGKLGKEEATKFIADMAILSDNDNMKNIINQAIDFGTRGAAAALITYQQGGEELDLEATGLFGFKKYNDAFKEAYTTTLEQLRAAEKESAPETATKDRPTLEQIRAETQRVDNLNREEKDKLLNELDTLLKKKEEERKDSAPTPSPKKDDDKPTTGTTKPGTSSKSKPTQYSKASTGTLVTKKAPKTGKAINTRDIDQAGRIRGGI